MVQPVENRAALEGVVQRVAPAGGGVTITLRVDHVDPVPGVANLLADTTGETITVTVPAGEGDALPQPGNHIRCQARLAGPQRYVAIPGSIQLG